ncbi:MAG: potassium transporter Kup [Verrucomicrobia bacterium]|nr:potassium transporter Kup [Verrucomicrobiota bacterium]
MDNDTTGLESAPVESPKPAKDKLLTLILGALGVVYGDIGTSVLYAFRECFNPSHGVHPTAGNVLGVLSLIFWALLLVVTVKYLFVVMRADNEGEGGIFALMARALSHEGPKRLFSVNKKFIIALGICGSALLVADGMITPTISVLSAVEGLQIAAPATKSWVLPISIGVLIGLFTLQKRGTARIGAWFGPIMVLWFTSIAALGIWWIIKEPGVLWAVMPSHAIRFFMENRLHGLIVLGAVVLCVTGCEALYADLGHFGRRPIAIAWHWFVFPSVLLNYFGQGSMVINAKMPPFSSDPKILKLQYDGFIPFFNVAPSFLIYPLVILATVATVIASQALISGMFSLVQQAIRFNYLPRFRIVHTSATMHGQIYVPQVNALLGVACVALALGFRDSSGMAAAYGIAVIGTMATTSLLMFAVEYEQWRWRLWQALAVTGLFLAFDFFFLVGNLAKILLGGWFTLAAAAGVVIVLTTWKRGNKEIRRLETEKAIPLEGFVRSLETEKIHRIPGISIFLTSLRDIAPRVLLHHLKHNRVLQERVVIMSAVTENVPSVSPDRMVETQDLGNGFHHVVVHCGFMQRVDMRDILNRMKDAGIRIGGGISYFIGHISLRTTGRTGMWGWRKALFAFLFLNEPSTTDFMGIPPNRVVELGEQAEI